MNDKKQLYWKATAEVKASRPRLFERTVLYHLMIYTLGAEDNPTQVRFLKNLTRGNGGAEYNHAVTKLYLETHSYHQILEAARHVVHKLTGNEATF